LWLPYKKLFLEKIMKSIKIGNLAKILNQPYSGKDVTFHRVQIDSREVQPGDLFVAIIGAKINAHDLIQEAKNKGAVAALISQDISVDIPYVKVPDTVKALGQWGAYARQQFTIPIIGVTGSCGKTTVKTMIYSILSKAYGEEQCFYTKGNLNTRVTMPIGLLDLNEDHRAAVIEMGMTHLGDLTLLSSIVKPTVATINNIALVHAESAGTLDDIMCGKSEIFSGLTADGVAVLNADEPYFNDWKHMVSSHKMMSFGCSLEANVRLQNVISYFDCCDIELVFEKNKKVNINLPLPGMHNAMNAACAAACAYAIGISPETIAQALDNMIGPERRFQKILGKNDSLIIDDGYNANPKAVKAVIDVLEKFPGKKILLLADMKELGADELQLHFEVGQYAKAAGIDYLIGVGVLAEQAAKGFGENGFYIKDRNAVAAKILPLLDKDTCLLAKGSKSQKVQEFVEQLKK
jgi:UDP-N-acetylmuramoyl-tripeptide--D-alanyl-D-alanine ligase